MGADLVIPSLDAGDENMFRLVNRPREEFAFEQMFGGLIEFRRKFSGDYWLEVFVLAGYTALPQEFAKIAQCISQIKPDRVQLNTVSRPPAEPCAIGAPLVRRTGPGERRGAHESRQIFQAALDLAASDNKTYFVWLPSWSSADCGKSRGPPVNTSTVTVRVSRPLRWDCCAEKTPFRSMRMSLPLRYL